MPAKRVRSRDLPGAASNTTVNSLADIPPQFNAFLYENQNATLNLVFAKFEESTGAKREHVSFKFI